MSLFNIITTIWFLIILSSCVFSQSIDQKTISLNGTYVELRNRTDTIVFSPDYNSRSLVFNLKRGFRMAEGYRLPDYFSGFYSYTLGAKSITMHWFLSSGPAQKYYFELFPGKDQFKIGNFFKDPEKKKVESDTLTFIRI